MFTITEGVVATLTLTGLDDPPTADGFSVEMANSYFAQDGVDVSLVWIGAELHGRMMQQHRDNLATPTQVTVDRLGTVDLGGVPVTEVVYYKARPVADPQTPGEIIEGYEATWQYIWPGDAARSHALLTIWRSGTDEISTLEHGFEDMRDRWQAGAALPGVLYDLRGAVDGERLILTGRAVEAPDVSWGRISVPMFHEHDDWQVVITPPQIEAVSITDQIVLDVPDMTTAQDLSEEIARLEAWLTEWSPVLEAFGRYVDGAGQAFRSAVAASDDEDDPAGPLSLFEAVMDKETGEMRLVFVIDQPDGGTHEGWVRLNSKGEVTGTEVYW